jgi:hypothetical protein
VSEAEKFCCKMREKFLLGIVGINESMPDPPDLIDFIDWDLKREDGKPVVRIRFCPFCGKTPKGMMRTDEDLKER